MNHSINRRRLVQAGSSAAVIGALGSMTTRALAQDTGELRVLVGGGDYGKAHIEASIKPFMAATGIKVNAVTDDFGLAKLELMASTKSITADVGLLNQGSAIVANGKGLLEQLDYSIYKKEELDAVYDFCKKPYGIAHLIYAFYMVYNTEKYPPGKPRPTNWAEFWDVKRFPGVRSMPAGNKGTEGPFEEALIADGVPIDKVYPMDIDRVFKSLDKIKPNVRKWWTVGSEIQQIMTDKAADLMDAFSGRSSLVISRGVPMEQNRNQAKLQWDYWVIPKGSPNAKNAQKFIEFATRADRQAAFFQAFPEGPTNRNAFKLLPDELGRKLPSHPDNVAKALPINAQWYNERGADGKSNAERMRERWNEWILS
jgi:putative spermidine/putrescine transport system substrate-binding protein